MTDREAWEFAKGMVMMDGVPPSDEVLALAEKEIRGEGSTEEIKEYLRKKYSTK